MHKAPQRMPGTFEEGFLEPQADVDEESDEEKPATPRSTATRHATIHYFYIHMWDKTHGKDCGVLQCVVGGEALRCGEFGECCLSSLP